MIVGKLQVSELESVSSCSLDVVHIKSWVFNGVDGIVESFDGVGIGSIGWVEFAVEMFDGVGIGEYCLECFNPCYAIERHNLSYAIKHLNPNYAIERFNRESYSTDLFNGVDGIFESFDGVGIGSIGWVGFAVEMFDGVGIGSIGWVGFAFEMFDGVAEVVAFDDVTGIEAF